MSEPAATVRGRGDGGPVGRGHALALVALLTLASLVPLGLMAREQLVERRALARYRLRPLREASARFHGHLVAVSDRAGHGRGFETGPVRVTVDGRDHSLDTPLRIATSMAGLDRYWGYLSMGVIEDREDQERLYVAQCLPADIPVAYPRSLGWRILLVAADGTVTSEVFAFDERGRPPYRTLLARTASPASLGFHSQVLTGRPGLLYPWLYPATTLILGLAVLEAASLLAAGARSAAAGRATGADGRGA